MPKIKIEQSQTETYIAQAGIVLVGKCLNDYAKVEEISAPFGPGGEVSNADIIRTSVGLLAQGKSDFEAAENVRNNKPFKLSLSIKRVLSASRLRRRMDENARFFDRKHRSAVQYRVYEKRQGTGDTDTSTSSAQVYTGHVVIDADATPYDNSGTKKEHVSWTYASTDSAQAKVSTAITR